MRRGARGGRLGQVRALALALALAPGLAQADGQMSGEEFRKYAEGYTLHFELRGQLYGAEQYYPQRRCLWRRGQEGCENGIWFERDGAICFSYETIPEPQCWIFTRRGADIFVRTVEDTDGLRELRVFRRDRAPLSCPGPSVGA